MSDSPAVNMRELMSLPTDQVERPRPLPEGHYICEIVQHEFGESRQKRTPFCRFHLRVMEPTGDVMDQAALEGRDLSRISLRTDYFITPNSLYRLSDALDNVLGRQAGKSFDERIPDMTGARVQALVTIRKNEDGTDSDYNDVDGRTLVAA